MFGLIRLAVLMLVAFLAGLFFERHQAGEVCEAAGGTFQRGLCRGVGS